MKKPARDEYPICPRCGSPVAGAMMTTSLAINPDGTPFSAASWRSGDTLYYHPDGISIYCTSADCNWDHPLSAFKTPVPEKS